MDRYAHSGRDQTDEALGLMLSLSEQTQQPTGTDDAPSIAARSANNSWPAAPRV